MEMSPFGWRQWMRMEAMDEACGGRELEAEAAGACGDATVGLDFGGGALAEDVGPPRAFGRRAQSATVVLFGELPGGERSAGQFAVAFVGVAMGAEFFRAGRWPGRWSRCDRRRRVREGGSASPDGCAQFCLWPAGRRRRGR